MLSPVHRLKDLHFFFLKEKGGEVGGVRVGYLRCFLMIKAIDFLLTQRGK